MEHYVRHIGYMLIKKLIIILSILLFSAKSFAYTETFYVRADGTGGSPQTSCATAGSYDRADFINGTNWDTDDANDGKIGPNDVVYLCDDGGNFAGDMDPPANKNGLAGKPITIMAYPGESPIISGGTNGMELQSSYLSFYNFRITAADNTNFYGNNNTYAINNIIIEGMEIDNSATGQGIYAGGATNGASNWEIRGNYIHDNGVDTQYDHGMYLYDADNVIVEKNYVVDNAAWGIHFHGGMDDGVARYNLVVRNGSQSNAAQNGGGMDIIYDAQTCDNNAFYGNVLIDNNVGIAIATGTASSPTNCYIYNNTVVNSWWAGFDSWGATADAGLVTNNIFWGTRRANANEDVFSPGSDLVFTSNYNIIGPEASGFIDRGGHVYDTLAAYQADWDGDPHAANDQNSIKTDPSFTTEPTDFSLRSDSPAKGAGADLGNGLLYGLDPTSTWVDNVKAVDQDSYGDWEIGAYAYIEAAELGGPGTIVGGGSGSIAGGGSGSIIGTPAE